METFLLFNGFELNAPVNEQETIVLTIASGKMTREEFASWLHDHIAPKSLS